MRRRWAIFLSGRGSNAQAVLEELHHLEVGICVTSKAQAYGAFRARRCGVPVLELGQKINWQELDRKLHQYQINAIFLLGFMKIIPADFCRQWQGRMWNLHPSLLPDFKGAQAIEQSFAAGGSMGVSIHEVTAELDAGPVRWQKKICQTVSELEGWAAALRKIAIAEQTGVRRMITRLR